MSINLRDLWEISTGKYELQLFAGKSGLDMPVTWVHHLEDLTTAPFLHHGELILTTAMMIKEENDWLLFVKALLSKNSSGLIVYCDTNLKPFPSELLHFCETQNFPLFLISQPYGSTEIIQFLCRAILSSESTECSASDSIKQIIANPELLPEYYKILNEHGFPSYGCYTLVLLEMKPTPENVPKSTRLETLTNQLRLSFKTVSANSLGFLRSDTQYLFVVKDFSYNEWKSQLKPFLAQGDDFRIIIGMEGKSLEELGKLAKQTDKLSVIARKGNLNLLYWNDLELDRLFVEIDNRSILSDYSHHYLADLLEYDSNNQTSYYETLKIYLNTGGSIQDVSKQLYVHRNTVNARMCKIKEIMHCELTPKERLNIEVAIHIHESLS